MKNRKIRIFTALFSVLLLMLCFSTTAFAGGGEDTTPYIPPETEAPQTPVSLTPDGNLTLVDDIQGEQSADKQFVTVISKNGNYFYLIIDRADDKENVYFLNLVDEADLLALIEEDKTKEPEAPKVCICSETCELGNVKADCPVCSLDMKKCIGKAAEVKDEPQPKAKNNVGGIIGILLVLGLGAGGAFYYFKVLKNKEKPKSNVDLEEYDFDDDEDDTEAEETVLDETEDSEVDEE